MNETLKLRSVFLFFVFIISYGVIVFNLYLIQIKHHTFYSTLAKQQYHVVTVQSPARGAVLDRSGKYLAMNKNYYSAFILPHQLAKQEVLLTFLQAYFPFAYARFEQNKKKRFMFIKRKLSEQERELIMSHGISDIRFLVEPGRYYPVPSTAQLIGLTDIDNKGIMGLELLYNEMLAGNPTTYVLERDARSGYYYFTKETMIQGDEGKELYTTIDADLQFLTYDSVVSTMQQYGAKEGFALIMNPINGEILSIVSCPSFDPNDTHTIHQEQCKNKVVTDAYEFGSVIKVFAALACLQEGVVTSDELIDCKNSKTAYIDGRKVNTTIAQGVVPFSDVIAFTNNIGIAIVAKRIDETLYYHYKKLGFGEKTGIEFPGESSGFVNHPSNWSKHSIISLSYGYEISTTLLQIACAFSIIATGHHVRPTLILTPSNDIKQTKEQLYSNASLEAIKDILEKTTTYGTARRATIKGYRVMSKTGTAEMLIDGKYAPDKNIYTCAGIVEKGDYKRVIVVCIKEIDRKRVYASTVVAPLFETVAEQMLIHDGVL